MKLSTRDKNLIVFVICAAIIVLAYVFGYSKFSDANVELEDEISKLEAQKKDLETQLLKKDFYEENIVTKTLEYNKLLAEYPEGINQENQFQFLLQLTAALNITDEDMTFSMTKAEEKYDFPGIYTYDEDYSGISSELSINMKLTYDQYKAFLKYIETCENAPSTLLLADGTTYVQEWPVHKTYLSSVSVEKRQSVEDEEIVENLVCSAKLKQLAITSEDRIYLDPTIVDIPGYQPALSKENIFEAEPEVPGTTDAKKAAIARAKASYDAKIEVEAGKTTMLARGDKGILESTGKADKDLYITIEEGGSAGLYFVTYSFGKDAYAETDKTGIDYKRMPVMPQDNFDILVVSDARYAEDGYKVAEDGSTEKIEIKDPQDKLNIHVNNTTQKQINLVVIGEPEISLEGLSDDVKATTIDGLKYVNADASNMTGSVNIIAELDEEVKALDLLQTPAA